MSLRKFSSTSSRSPDEDAARHWLRRVFVKDWNLKLLALAITLGLWFAVTAQHTPTKRQYRGVPLSFRTPAGVEIGNNPPEDIAITVRGPQSDLERINPHDLMMIVDVMDQKPGQRVVQLMPGRVQIELPDGVHLEGIEPSKVSLKLEPTAEREVEVEPRLEGKLSDGFELKQVVVTPNKITVRGPASHVVTLQKVPTETISIEGRRESFDLPQTPVYISDQKVDALETVNVHVEIAAPGNPKSKS